MCIYTHVHVYGVTLRTHLQQLDAPRVVEAPGELERGQAGVVLDQGVGPVLEEDVDGGGDVEGHRRLVGVVCGCGGWCDICVCVGGVQVGELNGGGGVALGGMHRSGGRAPAQHTTYGHAGDKRTVPDGEVEGRGAVVIDGVDVRGPVLFNELLLGMYMCEQAVEGQFCIGRVGWFAENANTNA